MKKYEFKNYITHRTAEIHVNTGGYEGFVLVNFFSNGEPDYSLRGCSEPGSGCKRFVDEASAIRSAKAYVISDDYASSR